METESSVSAEMEYSVSQQRAARSATVQNATAKMDLCLTDIQVSLNVFKSKLEKLSCAVKNQNSLEDLYETMGNFRTYFNEVKAYSKTIEDSFERQLGIILGDDYDRQLLCIENNCNPSSNQPSSDQTLACRDTKPDLQKLNNVSVSNEIAILPDSSGNICTSGDERPKSRSEESNQPSECNHHNDNQAPPKENALQNFSNSYESYDSSNDLPEAQANVLALSKQTSDCPTITPDSNPIASNEHCETSPTDVNPGLVSSVVQDSEPDQDRPPEDTSSNTKSSEKNKNTSSITGSEMADSLQVTSAPALFEASQDDNPCENESSAKSQEEQDANQQKCTPAPALFEASQDDHPCENETATNSQEKQDANQQNYSNTELEPNMPENTPAGLDSCADDIEAKDLKAEKKKTKRRNEMDATSKKVNDWLNTSVQSGHLSDENTSNDEEFPDLNERGDDKDDDKTQICDVGPVSSGANVTEATDVMESDDDRSLVAATNNNDNSSTSTKIFPHKPGKSQKSVNSLPSEDEEVIELSDDDVVATSVRIKRGSPISKFNQQSGKGSSGSGALGKVECVRESDDGIEVVELEETGDNDIDEICVIESSQDSKKSNEEKIGSRLAHSISESSESDTRAESCGDEVISKSKINGSLDTVTNSDKFMSNVATQEISSSIRDDEAKRKLLASSSSSSAASKGSQSDASDSDATVIVKKNKRFKKKKRRNELSKSISQSEVNSSDDDNEINRLLNLKSLRKRKRVSGSSGSSAENSSATSSSEIVRVKKKKKSKSHDSEMDLFSDASSSQNNQNSEHDSDHMNVPQNSSINEPTQNGDADIIHRNMLLASSCSSNSDEECTDPEVSKPLKNKKKAADSKANLEELDKENFLEEDRGKKKKRKYDPLLQGKFSLSSSESEQDKVTVSQDRKIHDQKYQKLLEKSKKRKEASRNILKENVSNSSDDDLSSESTGSGGSQPKNVEDPINFVSCDPECVEISEDDSDDDDCTTVGYQEVSTSSSENDDIQCIPQSQDTVTSNKSGRKNIKKIISSKELTEESKKAAKEEEERRRRVLEKEMLLSQTFSSPEVKKLVLDFDKDTKQELVTVHPCLMAVLKDHQIEGVKFMWNSCFETVNATKTTNGSGCVLAHCMGLGKSCQIVTLVHTIINHAELKMRTVLIMCPKSVVYNWGDEFSKWLSRIEEMDPNSKKVEIFDFIGFDEIRMKERRLRDWQEKGGVMIMSYTTFRVLVKPKTNSADYSATLYENIKKHLISPGPDVIVFDEGHILKNDSTEIHKAVDEVRTKRRIVLTGTPMQNSLMEYYFMVNLVKPNYLGDKKEFSNRFFNPINNGQFKDSTPQDVKIMKSRAHVLFKKMDGIVHRYDSNLIEQLLPNKRFEFVLKLKLTELQIKLYKSIIDSLKTEDANSAGTGLTQKEKNSRFMKNEKILHYICNHPKVLKDSAAPSKTEEQLNIQNDWIKCLEGVDLNDVKLSSKTVLFFEILQKCRENGDKLLVFSQQLKTLDLIEFFLKKASSTSSNIFQPSNSETKETWIYEKDYFRLDGKTPTATRHKYCNIFNSPNNKRMRLGLLSTKAGGLGMNLTGANRAIIFDVSWNPSSDSQSIFRIYRFGQEKPCYVYRFVAKGTMEEKKYHRQVSKLSTSSRVVDKRQVGRHYLEGHLRELYDYNFAYNENRSIPKVPPDNVLADLLLNSDCIDNFEEHDYLLRNILDEELSEEERRKAWEDYEREKNAPPPSTSNANSVPPGPSSYSNFNPIAGGLRYGQPNFSTNFQYAPPPASSGNRFPPGFFNSTWNRAAPGMNYRPPNFPNNFMHAFNPGSSNARNKTPTQQQARRKEQDVKKTVNKLLKNNIIPLPYEPLNKPASSSTKVPESAPKTGVSAGTTSAGNQNFEKVSRPEVNTSPNSVQNPMKRTIVVKPKNSTNANNRQNVDSSTSEKEIHQPAQENTSELDKLYSDFFRVGNDPSTGAGTSKPLDLSQANEKKARKDGQNTDPAPSIPASKRAIPLAGVNTAPATSSTAHFLGDRTATPVSGKTTPISVSSTSIHPGGDKTTPLVTNSTPVHPTDEAETVAPSPQPSSLNTIIEDLKNFVKAKKNGDPAS